MNLGADLSKIDIPGIGHLAVRSMTQTFSTRQNKDKI